MAIEMLRHKESEILKIIENFDSVKKAKMNLKVF